MPALRPGVLCIPFVDTSQPEKRNDHLRQLERWVVDAASAAEVKLAPIKGEYDSRSEVIAQIHRSIRDADIVVGVVHEVNPNVLYECGFAVGGGKPVLYVARDTDTIPFDIAGVERFVYTELSADRQADLTAAIRSCIDSSRARAQLTDPLTRAVQHFATHPVNNPRLFTLSLSNALSDVGDWITSITQSSFEVLGAASVLDAGTHILTNLSDAGFATQYYPGQASWQDLTSQGVREDYFLATREAVRRGRSVTRVYVVDDLSQIDDLAFRDTVMEDIAAGVNAQYVLASELPDERAIDFGIWDDELLAEIKYSSRDTPSPRLHSCTYRCDRASLRQAERWQNLIVRHAKPCPDLPSELRLLRDSAFALDDVGVKHCKEVHGDKVDCTDYHVPWQKLRLCGMVSTPSWHAGFYQDAVERWAAELPEHADGEVAYRVLAAGLADYGMLYWLIQSVPPSIRPACEFHVLDICRTPLESCVWLGQALNRLMPTLKLNVVPHHEDIFDRRRPDSTYDLLVSDAFLTRFESPADKAAVMEEWLRVVRPGGRIVTTARIRTGVDDIEEGDREAFVTRAAQRAQERDLDANQIRDAAHAYANYITSYPFASAAAVRDFLGDFADRASCDDLGHSSITEQEMVPAHYARIEIERV
jgi:nucleoside 2-deoxyribosyltransferase/SAM-dependent methyltransferase